MKHTLRSIGALLAVLAGAALIGTSAAGAVSAGNPWHGVPGDSAQAGHPWHGVAGDSVHAGHPWHNVSGGYHDSVLAGHPWSN